MTETLHAVGGADSKKQRAESNILGVVKLFQTYREITPEELAEALGISRATIYERLKGRSGFKSGEVAVLAEHFGVTVGVLYAGPDALMRAAGEGTISYTFAPSAQDIAQIDQAA